MNKLKSCAVAAVSSALLAGAVIAGCTSPARADDVPPYMSEIAGKTSSTAGETADKNIRCPQQRDVRPL